MIHVLCIKNSSSINKKKKLPKTLRVEKNLFLDSKNNSFQIEIFLNMSYQTDVQYACHLRLCIFFSYRT